MFFEPSHIYHIYNQGNNHQQTFFNRANYLYFLKKIRHHILPFSDILAWCLMPNHFHLMVLVNKVEILMDDSEGFTWSEALNKNPPDQCYANAKTLNDSIGILLRTYTRAINKQENRSGSIFRRTTKAECISKINEFTNAFFNTMEGGNLIVQIPEKEYLQECFNYIHQNPAKAGLVKNPEDWAFSSYQDYCGLRKGNLVNQKRAKEFALTIAKPG